MEKKTSTFLVILLCILVFVAGGGASYLYFEDAHSQETEALNSQIDQLETQVKSLKDQAKKAETTKSNTNSTTTTQTTNNTSNNTTSNWQSYSNKELGFSLTFTQPWTGYIVKTSKDGNSILFCAPTTKPLDAGDNYTSEPYAEIFSITKMLASKFDTDKAAGYPVGTEIKRSGNYIFVRDRKLDAYASNLKNKITEQDIKDVIDSFKLN